MCRDVQLEDLTRVQVGAGTVGDFLKGISAAVSNRTQNADGFATVVSAFVRLAEVSFALTDSCIVYQHPISSHLFPAGRSTHRVVLH